MAIGDEIVNNQDDGNGGIDGGTGACTGAGTSGSGAGGNSGGQNSDGQVRRPPYVRDTIGSRPGVKGVAPKIKLNANNLQEWRPAVTPYLMLSGVMRFIEEDLRLEDGDPSMEIYLRDERDNVALMLGTVDLKSQSRFTHCRTAREFWTLAISNTSSEVVRMCSILNEMDKLSPVGVDPDEFVDRWITLLQSYTEAKNSMTLETTIAFIVHRFPASLNDVSNTMSKPKEFATTEQALQTLRDLLKQRKPIVDANPNVVMNVRKQKDVLDKPIASVSGRSGQSGRVGQFSNAGHVRGRGGLVGNRGGQGGYGNFNN